LFFYIYRKLNAIFYLFGSFIDYFSGLVFSYCNRLYGDLQIFFLSSINESHLYLLPAIMVKCMFNVHKNQQSLQTGCRNLMGPKTLPTIRGTYMKLVTKYQISTINSCLEKCDEKCAYHQIPTSCLQTLLIFMHIEHTFCMCPFLVAFFSATIDGRNLCIY
jgi:hypothetical protein